MKIFGSIVVLSMLSVMVSADNVSPPTGHTTGRSRVRARNLSGNSVSNSNDIVSNNVDISPPTGHTTGRSRVRARNLRGTKNGSK